MTATPTADRYALTTGLRHLANWLDSDSTIPAPPDLTIGFLVADVDAVARFARIHNLEPYFDGDHLCADAWFGPVVHRVYALARRRRPALTAADTNGGAL